MHGTLRFVLATLVALSHLGILWADFNQGVFAVVIFYMLAGMVSYKLIVTYFQNKPFLYYKDRLKRIAPFYIASLIVASSAYLLGATSYYISKEPTLLDLISNITIIPLSYYMYNSQDTFTLLPPAWSLGVEIQFYILAPFLLTSKKLFTCTLICSLVVFSLASISIINVEYFGYRLLIGVIFIFLLGAMIQKEQYKKQDTYINILAIYTILIALFVYIYFIGEKLPYNYETISALLVGIPLLLYFKSPMPKKIDQYLGFISYGIFLLHFPALWIVSLLPKLNENLYIVLILTVILSMIIQYTIEKFQEKVTFLQCKKYKKK